MDADDIEAVRAVIRETREKFPGVKIGRFRSWHDGAWHRASIVAGHPDFGFHGHTAPGATERAAYEQALRGAQSWLANPKTWNGGGQDFNSVMDRAKAEKNRPTSD